MNFDLNPPLCRATDPLTSYQAADAAKITRESQERLVVSILEQYGPQTVDGISSFCKLTGHEVGKRVKRLREMEKIKLTGRVGLSAKGKPMREWAVR